MDEFGGGDPEKANFSLLSDSEAINSGVSSLIHVYCRVVIIPKNAPINFIVVR